MTEKQQILQGQNGEAGLPARLNEEKALGKLQSESVLGSFVPRAHDTLGTKDIIDAAPKAKAEEVAPKEGVKAKPEEAGPKLAALQIDGADESDRKGNLQALLAGKNNQAFDNVMNSATTGQGMRATEDMASRDREDAASLQSMRLVDSSSSSPAAFNPHEQEAPTQSRQQSMVA